jgi:hypothetical protein
MYVENLQADLQKKADDITESLASLRLAQESKSKQEFCENLRCAINSLETARMELSKILKRAQLCKSYSDKKEQKLWNSQQLSRIIVTHTETRQQ